MTKVAVVIVNWNGAEDTITCIRSLWALAAANLDLSIVVTDNASSDGSLSTLKTFLETKAYESVSLAIPSGLTDRVSEVVAYRKSDCLGKPVTLAAAIENTGFAGGNNIGVAVSQAIEKPDFLWFLNSDTEVHPDALSILVEKMEQEPDIGMCGSTLIYASDRVTVQSYGGAYYSVRTGRGWSARAGQAYDVLLTDTWAEQQINYVSGAAMFVRASMLDSIGMMCEDYFLYNEEIDLAVRASGRFRLGVAIKSIIYHSVGKSIGTEGVSTGASRLSTFYQTRSKLLFARKHYWQYYPIVWVTLLLRGLKFYRFQSRRPEAKVIFRVLAGKKQVDRRWFAERQGNVGGISATLENA